MILNLNKKVKRNRHYNVDMVIIGGKQFELVIERKRNKNIYLRVEGNTIKVTCPYYVNKSDILAFIEEKSKWIVSRSNSRKVGSKLTVGETIFYKGEEYKLVILKGTKNIKIDEDTIYIRCRNADLKGAISVFYEYGKKIIKEYAISNQDKYLKILRDYGYYLEPEYNVKYLKSMWGVCYNNKNIINLSVRLIHFSDKCLEAILWHELLHFIIPNHSKRYHEVIDRVMPDYNEIIKTLY